MSERKNKNENTQNIVWTECAYNTLSKPGHEPSDSNPRRREISEISKKKRSLFQTVGTRDVKNVVLLLLSRGAVWYVLDMYEYKL